MQISVVSGTYNRLSSLQKMVESVRQSAAGLAYEIVLVDGGSTDGTQEWCKAQGDIVLIEQHELLGAIRAFNAGFAAARGEYVIIGNDDIIFNGDTIARSLKFMQEHPGLGQGAFAHKYLRRKRFGIQRASGYVYGQCSIVPKWLGDAVGWWGNEGMRSYGGDTRLSLRIWELGWPVQEIPGCSVTDKEEQDGLREINSDTPWRIARERGKTHHDLDIFNRCWTNRLPLPDKWIPSAFADRANAILEKAAAGRLRVLRFKQMMRSDDVMRRGMIEAWRKYGDVEQINQNAELKQRGREGFYKFVQHKLAEFNPDVVILQAVPGVMNSTNVQQWRKQFGKAYWINFDGDTHPDLQTNPFYFDIARSVDLQCTISPSLLSVYARHGISTAYWPIGIEPEYLEVQRETEMDYDVVFLGTLYGANIFPEAATRRAAVESLSQSHYRFGLFGGGWQHIGLTAQNTLEQHGENALIYARAKLALSISHVKDLWGYTSDRLYNITATGCPALVQRFEGMEAHGYIDGKTCIAWETIPEMLEKIDYYLQHDEEREAIGQAGREMTLARHTWDVRLLALFEMIEDRVC